MNLKILDAGRPWFVLLFLSSVNIYKFNFKTKKVQIIMYANTMFSNYVV